MEIGRAPEQYLKGYLQIVGFRSELDLGFVSFAVKKVVIVQLRSSSHFSAISSNIFSHLLKSS